jgi:hypothetical protein
MTRHAAGRCRRTRGQALVEFSLVLPVFLALLFGMVDLGRVIWANVSLANAAREAARYAIVHGGSTSNLCPVGPPPPTLTIPAASTSCPHPSPSKQSIVDAAHGAAVAAGSGIVVTVCYGAGCTGNTDVSGTTNLRGTPVTVRVTGTVPLLTGAVAGFGSFTVTGESTMLVNY